MHVLFLAYTPGNPYQDLLRKHLKKLGVSVQMSTGLLFLPGLLSLGNPRVVHLHWLEPYYIKNSWMPAFVRLIVFSLQLAFLLFTRTMIVWTVHNLANHEGRNRRLERLTYSLVYRAAHRVIVHCENAREQLQYRISAALVNPKKIRVIPIGDYSGAYANTISRAEARSRLGFSADDFVFLSLGAIREYKGGTDLINAFRKIGAPFALKLVIAGRAHKIEARNLIEDAAKGLEDSFRFVPTYIPDEDIQIYLNAADVFVAPFREVLTSSSVVLALAFGDPVIAPRLGCLPETMGDASDFLYDPSETDGLKDALQSAIDRREELPLLGSKGREVVDRLSWDRIAKLTFRCYRPQVTDESGT